MKHPITVFFICCLLGIGSIIGIGSLNRKVPQKKAAMPFDIKQDQVKEQKTVKQVLENRPNVIHDSSEVIKQ